MFDQGEGAWYISNRLGFGIIKSDLGLGVLGPRVSDGPGVYYWIGWSG